MKGLSNHALRKHVLQRLARLVPSNTDGQALESFILERAEIIQELENIPDPWTEEDEEILASAIRNAEEITQQLQGLHRQIGAELAQLRRTPTWKSEAEIYKGLRISKRY